MHRDLKPGALSRLLLLFCLAGTQPHGVAPDRAASFALNDTLASAENVVVTGDGITKLCDFGLAIDTNVDTPTSRVGTLEFMVRCSSSITLAAAAEAHRLLLLLLTHLHPALLLSSPTLLCCPLQTCARDADISDARPPALTTRAQR